MTTDMLTCPYCNAAIGAPPGLTAGQRIVCPRCGDAFPFRPLSPFTNQPPSSSEFRVLSSEKESSALSTQHSELRTGKRWSNRAVASVVLGIMLLMAGIGLAFMLMTQDVRRAHDTSRPPRRPGRQRGVPEPDIPSFPVTVAPDKLTALGYLPPDVNFLIGARIPELLASPLGMQVLRDPLKLGEAEYPLKDLPSWVGLRVEDIDHLVLAAKIDDALLPLFYLVLRTNRRYEEDQLRRRLQGTHVANASKKNLFSFHPRHKDVVLHAWPADEHTLILALFRDQLESLPSKPVEDLRQLPDEVRSVLKTRREPVAPVWIVGHSPDWSKTTAVRFLNRLKKEDLDKLCRVQTFGLWLIPEKSLLVRGVCACEDAAAARDLEGYFRSLHDGDATFKTALDGPWLSLQFQTGPEFLWRWMKR